MRRPPIPRGKLILVALIALFAIVAAACGSDGDSESSADDAPPSDADEPAEEPTEEPPDEPAEAGGPVTGGELVFARFFDTQSLNPMGVVDNGSIFVRVQIFNTLVEADPDTIPEVGPGLADEWSSSEDGLT